MSQDTVYFKAVYPDTDIAAKATKGLRYIANYDIYRAVAYFKEKYNIEEIGSTVLDCYNWELSRRKNILTGTMDTPDYEEPGEFIEMLTCTNALSIELTLSHDETGEETVFKIDNKSFHDAASAKQSPKAVPYADLDAETLQKVLFKAILKMDMDTIKAVYESGVNINFRFKDGVTALMKASSYKRTSEKSLELLQALLRYGADVNAISDEQDTALYNALEACNFKVVQLLVEAGAHVNGKWGSAAEYVLGNFAYALEGEGVIEKEKEYVEILDFLIKTKASTDLYFEDPPSFSYDGSSYNGLLRSISSYNLIDLLKFLMDYGISCEKLAYIVFYAGLKGSKASDLIRNRCRGTLGDRIKEIDRKLIRKQEIKQAIEAAQKAFHVNAFSRVIYLLDPIHKNGELGNDKWILDKANKELSGLERKGIPEHEAKHTRAVLISRPGKTLELEKEILIDLVWGLKKTFDFHPVSIWTTDLYGKTMRLDDLEHLTILVYNKSPFNLGMYSNFNFEIDDYGTLNIGKLEAALSATLYTKAIYFKGLMVSPRGIEIRFKIVANLPEKDKLPAFEKTKIGRLLVGCFEKYTHCRPGSPITSLIRV